METKVFKGQDLIRLKQFLAYNSLKYDEGIEHTVCIFNEEGEIKATGSVEQNVIKCVAVSPEYQGMGLGEKIVTNLMYYEIEKGRTHVFLYTKPENQQIFAELGFYTIICTTDILFMENRKTGFLQYVQKLRLETKSEALEKGKKIGCVVANCNPFTLGHLHLIKTALKICDFVHLFIVSDNRSQFTEKQRLEMAEIGIEGLDRVFLHKTSEYIVSAATFPTYFFKDKVKAQEADCVLDLKLFAERIAPALNIKERFVGNEPFCRITEGYNQEMKNLFPDYDIQVREIKRMEVHGKAVSASRVRNLIDKGKIQEVRQMVPEKVFNYLNLLFS